MKKILVMNGPNLNLTGIRKKNVYGSQETLEDINRELAAYGEDKGVQVDFYQSNHEGALIDKIHASRTDYDGVVLNAGAYTHYSYAIRDAIEAVQDFTPCGGAHERYSPAGGFSPDFRADPGVREANLRFWQRQLQNGY